LSKRQNNRLVIAQCYGGAPLEVAKAFHKSHPEILLNQYMYTPDVIVQQLILEKLDVAILDKRFMDPRLNGTPLIREELFLGISRNHPLAAQREISLQDLTQFRFNCNTFMITSNYIVETGRKYGLTLDICYEGNDFLTNMELSPNESDVAVLLTASSVAEFYSRDPGKFDEKRKVLRILPSVFFRELELVRYDEHPITAAEKCYCDYVIGRYKQINAQVKTFIHDYFPYNS
jgi:DNA-binding transcriptional LysR family regulator